VVQVQVVDAGGVTTRDWTTIEPKTNRYDSAPAPGSYGYCYFDPIDDGNTEDDLFDYFDADPPVGVIGGRYLSVGGWYVTHGAGALLGPSSNCFPNRVFASAGDTDEPFDPANLNGPVEGPGLRGSLGPGTWVEPRFSLDAYRGRRIRLRFLTSGWQAGEESWDGPGPQDDSVDDGWWIDDVTITHTLMDPATVTVDDKDNSALAVDTDGDCIGDTADCRPGDDQIWSRPGEVTELNLSHTGGESGITTLTWGPPTTSGATFVSYFVIESDPQSCSDTEMGSERTMTHTSTPAPGQLHTFLVQAENLCGRGSLGNGTTGSPRAGCN
jgi:hypothetical protein